MSLYRLDASIRVEGSHSREIADVVEQEWRTAHPSAEVVRRHVGTEPVPSTAWAAALAAGMTPEAERTPDQVEAAALAAREVDALASADALLFAVPLYNFGVSQHFKTWVDLVVTVDTDGTALLYENGKQVESYALGNSGINGCATGRPHVGADQGGGQVITADVDRSAVFSRALSASEVADWPSLAAPPSSSTFTSSSVARRSSSFVSDSM